MQRTHTRASVYCAGRPPPGKRNVPKPPDTHPEGGLWLCECVCVFRGDFKSKDNIQNMPRLSTMGQF
uniref:Uncharacterized protein n=1 Tax=Anopheles quadriannulatus TaxID=34691 RepID=A0A182XSY2_ANOQN